MSKHYFTYILTNKAHGTLYIGVTNDLIRRVWQHRQKLLDGFTKKYNLRKLVYYEVFNDVREAIKREKQMKNLVRRKKIALIEAENPEWRDLYADLL